MARTHHMTIDPGESIIAALTRWDATAPAGYSGIIAFRRAPRASRFIYKDDVCFIVDNDQDNTEQEAELRDPWTDPNAIPILGDPYNPSRDAILSVARRTLEVLECGILASTIVDQNSAESLAPSGRCVS